MKDKNEVIKQLKTTPIVQITCQKNNISRATYYRWRKKDKVFKEQTDNALKKGINFINDLAESQLISLIKDKNPTSIFYWLNNHHPNYSDKKIYLSREERLKLIKTMFSDNNKNIYKELVSNVFKGKISRFFFNTLISIAKKSSSGSDINDEKNKLDTFYKVINQQQRNEKL